MNRAAALFQLYRCTPRCGETLVPDLFKMSTVHRAAKCQLNTNEAHQRRRIVPTCVCTCTDTGVMPHAFVQLRRSLKRRYQAVATLRACNRFEILWTAVASRLRIGFSLAAKFKITYRKNELKHFHVFVLEIVVLCSVKYLNIYFQSYGTC